MEDQASQNDHEGAMQQTENDEEKKNAEKKHAGEAAAERRDLGTERLSCGYTGSG